MSTWSMVEAPGCAIPARRRAPPPAASTARTGRTSGAAARAVGDGAGRCHACPSWPVWSMAVGNVTGCVVVDRAEQLPAAVAEPAGDAARRTAGGLDEPAQPADELADGAALARRPAAGRLVERHQPHVRWPASNSDAGSK